MPSSLADGLVRVSEQYCAGFKYKVTINGCCLCGVEGGKLSAGRGALPDAQTCDRVLFMLHWCS